MSFSRRQKADVRRQPPTLPSDTPRYRYHLAAPAPPAVSIITPYYNTGPLFLETVDSILRQSLQQWEWIVVNDGSDDPLALRALLPLRSADARIKVIDLPHVGPSAARNAGVAASSGELLFFIDSDDMLAPTALEKLAWTLASHPESAFATGWTIAFGHENLLWPRGFDTRYAHLYENMVSSCLAMVRRSVFEQVGGFEATRTRGLEDYEFWLRCAAHGFWGHDIYEYLLWLRRKPPTAYSSYRWDFNNGPEAEREFLREMRARYPHLFRNGLPALPQTKGLLNTRVIIKDELPFTNRLQRPEGQRRVLMLTSGTRGEGDDHLVLDLAGGLTACGGSASACLMGEAENPWIGALDGITSDVFNLATFLTPADYPRFLRYVIESRQITTVLIWHSLLAYQLLPYLRAHYPHIAFVDYLGLEEKEQWHTSVERDSSVDMHIVSSEHLRDWMIERGVTAKRIAVCTNNCQQTLGHTQTLLDQASDAAGRHPRPRIDLKTGRLAVTLAIEQYLHAEHRRRIAPVRVVLAFQQTAFWQRLDRICAFQVRIEAIDRILYSARRNVMKSLRRVKRAL